jgi:hypothetical protein
VYYFVYKYFDSELFLAASIAFSICVFSFFNCVRLVSARRHRLHSYVFSVVIISLFHYHHIVGFVMIRLYVLPEGLDLTSASH